MFGITQHTSTLKPDVPLLVTDYSEHVHFVLQSFSQPAR